MARERERSLEHGAPACKQGRGPSKRGGAFPSAFEKRTLCPMSRSCLAVAVLALSLLPSVVGAQALSDARDALTAYDVQPGGRALGALRDLGPLAGRGDAEARYLRAVAGTEIYAAATIGADDALLDRLATALGIAAPELATHLDAELLACHGGTFGRGADEARTLLRALTLRTTDPSALLAMRGPHRDALLVMAFLASDDRASLIADPCTTAHGRRIAEPGICDWDEPSRRALAAGREALRALSRAQRARADGDPMLALLGSHLETAGSAIAAIELHPLMELPETLGVVTLPATFASRGTAGNADALVVVSEAEVHLRVLPTVRVSGAGELVWVRAATSVEVDLPREFPAVPQPLDALVSALGALGLPADARLILAPTAGVPCHVLTRVVLSAQRAHLVVSHLGAHRESDGERLLLVPITAARESELSAIDARVQIQMGGYGLARGIRGRAARIPRVRVDGHLMFDAATLATRLAPEAIHTVALQAMGTVPAAELVHVAFATESPTRSLTLLLP